MSGLRGARNYSIIPDRIEAGSYILAGIITGGRVLLEGARTDHLESLIDKLCSIGAVIEENEKGVEVRRKGRLSACDIETMPYPGFPTDLQAPWTALMSTVKGSSLITENIFENRFLHIGELQRMGANIQIKGKSLMVQGVKRLTGAPVMATDLRGGIAMILAGLVAHGKTEIQRIYHLKRGYERLIWKLGGLGARIKETKK